MLILVPQIVEYKDHAQSVIPYPSLINSLGDVSIYIRNYENLPNTDVDSNGMMFIEDANSVYVDDNIYVIIKESKIFTIPVDNVVDIDIKVHTPVKLTYDKYLYYPYMINTKK